MTSELRVGAQPCRPSLPQHTLELLTWLEEKRAGPRTLGSLNAVGQLVRSRGPGVSSLQLPSLALLSDLASQVQLPQS